MRCCFFFQAEDGIRDYKVSGVQTCALPIFYILPDQAALGATSNPTNAQNATVDLGAVPRHEGDTGSVEVFWPCVGASRIDRKSTRLNSSHLVISYAVFCLKKKKPYSDRTST